MDSAVRMRERFRKDESNGLKVNIFGVMFSKVYGKQRKSLLSEESGHSLGQVSSELELSSWGACGTGGGKKEGTAAGDSREDKGRQGCGRKNRYGEGREREGWKDESGQGGLLGGGDI